MEGEFHTPLASSSLGDPPTPSLLDLPEPILLRVLSEFPPLELLRLRLTCKTFAARARRCGAVRVLFPAGSRVVTGGAGGRACFALLLPLPRTLPLLGTQALADSAMQAKTSLSHFDFLHCRASASSLATLAPRCTALQLLALNDCPTVDDAALHTVAVECMPHDTLPHSHPPTQAADKAGGPGGRRRAWGGLQVGTSRPCICWIVWVCDPRASEHCSVRPPASVCWPSSCRSGRTRSCGTCASTTPRLISPPVLIRRRTRPAPTTPRRRGPRFTRWSSRAAGG